VKFDTCDTYIFCTTKMINDVIGPQVIYIGVTISFA